MRHATFEPSGDDESLDSDGTRIFDVAGRVEIVRQLSPQEVDHDSGDMFVVRNPVNGASTHAFADELSAWSDRT